MRHFNIMAAIAATLLVGGIASAKEKPEAAKEKKICVLSEDSASRLGVKRICRTKAEWDNGTSQSRRQAEPATEEAAGRN